MPTRSSHFRFVASPRGTEVQTGRWTGAVEDGGDIGWIFEGLSTRQICKDVRYLTGEEIPNPFSQGRSRKVAD